MADTESRGRASTTEPGGSPASTTAEGPSPTDAPDDPATAPSTEREAPGAPDAPEEPATLTATVPEGSTEPARSRRPVPARLRTLVAAGRDLVARHRLIAGALALGAAIRAVAMLGYRPAMWFNDAFEYLGVARRFEPYPIRPNGYSAMLRLLEPFHSFALVAAVQHLMGLVAAGLLYALLRRWGLPAWLATAGALPQLFDGNQIQLEHVILSDTLFTVLMVGGLTAALWNRSVTWPLAATAGLLLAATTLTRVVGLPLLALVGVSLVVRRVGWRPVAAFAVAATLPLLGYAAWFRSVHGQFALTTSDGIFLYSRVAVFADCGKIDPPERLEPLCESRPPRERGDISSNYIWHPSALGRLPGVQPEPLLPPERFSAERNGPAGEFARAAILAQPGDYLRVGWKDVVRTFQWGREPFPNVTAYSRYYFNKTMWPIAERVYVPGGTARADTTAYERGAADTRLIEPWSDVMIQYQRFLALRGTLLLVLLVAGTAGVGLALWRRSPLATPLLVLWATAVALVVIPPFTAQYDLRYVIPAGPLLGAAVACAVKLVLDRGPAPAPSG